jgi:hypothetical protein
MHQDSPNHLSQKALTIVSSVEADRAFGLMNTTATVHVNSALRALHHVDVGNIAFVWTYLLVHQGQSVYSV